MAVTEPTINTKLADVLRRMNPRWSLPGVLRSQQTQRVVGQPGKQPDLELSTGNAAPVVIEAEIHPARTVEDDASNRLGKSLTGSTLPLETVVALRYPARFKTSAESDLDRVISSSKDLEWALLTETGGRNPSNGWVSGTVADLAAMLEIVELSPRVLRQAADTLEGGVGAVATHLAKMNQPASLQQIAADLYQSEGEQTWRMAASIITNAFLFQEAVTGHLGTPSIAAMTHTGEGEISKLQVLNAWQEILEINYYPIFHIARQIVTAIPTTDADVICDLASQTALRLASAGVNQVQNMAGQMFGELITDRKFLATFYTLPSSARLLAELAVERLDADWEDSVAVTSLKIADFACGTGALLSTMYETIGARVRRAGGDDTLLHSAMIERVLIGADIMPAAAHLTTTMLSTKSPSTPFNRCGIHVSPYGKHGNEIAVGSLDLLRDQGAVSLFPTHQQVTGTEGPTEQTDSFVLDDDSCDVVVMNPPSTRPTSHERADALMSEGQRVPIVPSFAGFKTTDDEQTQMSIELKNLVENIKSKRKKAAQNMQAPELATWASHGNAGLASNFVDLADAKLKPGGVLALVLPFAAVSGESWAGFRQLVDRRYDNVHFITIATSGGTDRAFSADTAMAETLLIATKRLKRSPNRRARCTWTSINRRPNNLIESLWFANEIQRAASADHVTPLSVGGDRIGDLFTGPDVTVDDSEFAGISEPEIAQTALSIQSGDLLLAGHHPLPLPITTLGELGKAGPLHRDINGTDRKTGEHRGPFDLEPTKRTMSYPILWAHDAKSGRESAMEVRPDRSGRIRTNMREQAVEVSRTSTRLHINSDFRLNSQRLGACMTPNGTIGGRAWPSFCLEDRSWEAAICVWLNTTFGLVSRWSVSNRQQQGRATLTVSTLHQIPVIDPKLLKPSQIIAFNGIFEMFRLSELLPANETWRDIERKKLDEAVAHVLEIPDTALPALDTLRRQWCEEPSVHGGKSTRP